MSKCPNCGAETRPGDNFCLSCGYPIPASPPASFATDEATVLGSPPPASNSWPGGSEPAVPDQDAGEATLRANAVPSKIENPARFVLSANKGGGPREYPLEKPDTSIGRAPENDIILPDEEKVISRYHATIRYENGSYLLRDDGSSNGTYVNGQLLEKASPRMLQDGDRVTIGDYELVFYAPASVADESTLHGSLSDLNFETMESQDRQTGHEGIPTLVLQDNAEVAAVPPPPPETITPFPQPAQAAPAPVQPATGISIQRFTNLSQPLPDIAALKDAATALDGQVASLQQQIDAVREAKSKHETEISETANQLRTEMQDISASMSNAIQAMSDSRAEVGLDNLVQLVQEVMSNPRDIDNARTFAGRAADVNKLIQRFEDVFKTLNECNNQLRSVTGEN